MRAIKKLYMDCHGGKRNMKIKLDPDSANWFYDFIHVKLEEKFEVIQRNEIDYGCQLKLKTGEVVNIYYTLKFQLGGGYDGNFFKLLCGLMNEFKWAMETDKENEILCMKLSK